MDTPVERPARSRFRTPAAKDAVLAALLAAIGYALAWHFGAFELLHDTARPREESYTDEVAGAGLLLSVALAAFSLRRWAELRRQVRAYRRAEEALKASEEKYRLVSENIPCAVYSALPDEPSTTVFVSGRIGELTGYTAREFLDDPSLWSRILHPDDRRRTWDAVQAHRRRKTPLDVEYRVMTRNGAVKWIHDRAVPMLGDAGEIVRIDGYMEDITRRRAAQDAVRQTERQQELVLSSITELVVRQDTDGRILWANRAAAESAGMQQRHLIGRRCYEVWHKRHGRCEACPVQKAVDTAKPQSADICTPDGRVYDIRGYPVQDEKGRVIGATEVTLDVTDRRRAEEQLMADRRQLRSLASQLSMAEERERRRLAAYLHDTIAQSLTSAKLKADTLRQAAPSPEMAEDIGQVSHLISQSVQDARLLISDLAPPSLYELGIEAALASLADRAAVQHGLAAELQDDGRPKPLTDDVRAALYRATGELLLNVAKHAGVRTATLSVRRADDRIRIAVADDGVGFDPQRLRPQSDALGGFGLFSIHERLTHLGGRLDVRSRPGQGTTVVLEAPLDGTVKAP